MGFHRYRCLYVWVSETTASLRREISYVWRQKQARVKAATEVTMDATIETENTTRTSKFTDVNTTELGNSSDHRGDRNRSSKGHRRDRSWSPVRQRDLRGEQSLGDHRYDYGQSSALHGGDKDHRRDHDGSDRRHIHG
ncbi:hypothetical protein PoB_004832800 [Plakobranchus ocellatus]|uniref:Uncharacterized protein n=1 Tax=Plakobranchus ocellatus TaxID=259542 RepID=A0AAV4BSP6_9GAST|nr:hypothetical protein PoB_004832800 [Plakobranchus ocellatus]